MNRHFPIAVLLTLLLGSNSSPAQEQFAILLEGSPSPSVRQLSEFLKDSATPDGVVLMDSREDPSPGFWKNLNDLNGRSSDFRLVVYLSGTFVHLDDDILFTTQDKDPQMALAAGLSLKKLKTELGRPGSSRSNLLFCNCRRSNASDTNAISADTLLEFMDGTSHSVVYAVTTDPSLNQGTVFTSAVEQALTCAEDEHREDLSAGELYSRLFTAFQGESAGDRRFIPKFKISDLDADSTVISVRSLKVPQFRFTNLSARERLPLHLRIDGTVVRIEAGKTTELPCRDPDRLHYCRTGKATDEASWHRLYKTPNDQHEFRLTRQLDGSSIWVAGFTNSVGMQMTLIAPGQYEMGQREQVHQYLRRHSINTSTLEDTFAAETPLHTVNIQQPFFIGTHEVTVGQFKSFVDSSSFRTAAEGNNNVSRSFIDGSGNFQRWRGLNWSNPGIPQGSEHPVVHVTWEDANAFSRWLSLGGLKYSLPSEAQWEYAARAGSDTIFWNGDDPENLTEIANVRDASLGAAFPGWRKTLKSKDGFVYTAPVGSFAANPFGLHDMHGNVWEWCADVYDSEYYRLSPWSDPLSAGPGTEHVYRGGCFY